MKQFACGDVVPGCIRVFSGTEQEILDAVFVHAQGDHGMADVPQELVDQVRSKIQTV